MGGHRWKRWLCGALVVAAGLVLAMARRHFLPTPAESLRAFYVYDGAEDTLMDPLILAGPGVVPLVLEQLPNPHMPRRRYAIAFLGNGSFTRALPALRAILTNEAESDLFRGDALRAISCIDASEGKRTALAFASRPEHLGHSALEVLQRGCPSNRRTRADAAAGYHE